jgi:3-phosphoshikimate 1-carboxyvinyltransferase
VIEEDNDDLFVLSRALHDVQVGICESQVVDGEVVLNLNNSGTALRFLTAYCAVSDGEFLLTGSERLCERPIRSLVDALRCMGADISYVDKVGFAPLRIRGKVLNGGRVSLDVSESSQFASALMLIADMVEGGVDIEFSGDVVSRSYICLTESVIEKYRRGVCCSRERDWSSATVWYAAMAILRRGEFVLDGLLMDSMQPDRAVVDVFEKLGVQTIMVEQGVRICSGGDVVDRLVLDCVDMPDAVMYIVVAACLLGIRFEISGVKTLRLKESDRLDALMVEMRKLGFVLICDELGKICWEGELDDGFSFCQDILIKTYNDHRIAMAMAIVKLVRDVEIENPEVVCKSYPGFWREFDKIKGFCNLV